MSSLPLVPTAGGALAGALLTVAVYEGSARLVPAEGPAQTLGPGASREVRLGPPAPGAADTPAPALDPRNLPAPWRARVASLKEENARLRFENALVKGNLASHEGQVLPWPEALPAALRPEGFAAQVRAAAEAHPGVDLVDVDCSEYPCLAIVRGDGADPAWQDRAMAVPEAVTEALGDGYGVVAVGRGEDDGERAVMLLGFAVVPAGEGPPDPALGTRVSFRAEERMGSLAEELREGAGEAGAGASEQR